jgi:AsmA-like C-terminal region
VTTLPQSRRHIKRIALVTACVLVAALLAGMILVHHFWPFGESSVRSRLAESASSNVKFGSFHEKYFPPGCVAENVIFQRDRSGPPLISIQRLTIRSNLGGLLGARVSLVRAEGMHVILSRADFSGTRASGKQTTVSKLVADDAVLEVHRKGSAQPLRFVFHKFQLENLGGSGATKFAAEFDNPVPNGLIRTSGQFGPWNSSDPAATVVSGKYRMGNADLAEFKSIAGITSSEGDFKGTFKDMEVEGSSTTPEFEVTSTHHKLPLQTHFSAAVNATNGETILRRVKASFGRDEIDAQGRIGRDPHGKRAAIIDLTCNRGRIEDTFYPFIHSPKSPLTGNVAFQMHIVIPSGQERFLKKLELKSDFRITDARFTNPQTESRLEKVSERPDQKQPEEGALATFKGQVTVLHGIAHFAELTAQDGDALAWFRGNYDLTDERVNMHGKLKTEASLTKTTSGIKAVFAKALEPLFKKGRHAKVIPVKISGTFHHPSFGLDMDSDM